MGSWIRTGASQPELEVLDFHVFVSKSFNKSVYLAQNWSFTSRQPVSRWTRVPRTLGTRLLRL